jgi:sulfoxide reductase heme-binding subunit YedZ
MTIKSLNNRNIARLKIGLFILALVPLIYLVARACLDGLGANPIEKVTRSTGYWTLFFLMITLAVTPLRKLFGWNWLVRMRRMVALYAFFYGSLHFLTYLVLDQFFDFPAIFADIVKRPYITVGFPSYVLMIPLALTSTDRMIRRLGGKRWRLLHRLVYPIAVGGVVHYWWLVKKDISEPLMFALILGLLFGVRLFSRILRYARPALSRLVSGAVHGVDYLKDRLATFHD